MTLISYQSSQLANVTQRAVTGRGIIRGCTINVNQVVSKDTPIVNQSGVRSSGLVDTESAVTQSAKGTHIYVTQNAIEVTAAK
jgi:hypothetical protein